MAADGTLVAAIPFTAATVTQVGATFTVAWEADGVDDVAVYAGTDPEAIGTDRPVGAGAGTGEITVAGLPAAARWYFELVPSAGGPLVVADRSLHLGSAPNLRDVGGTRTQDGRWVKMGRLYRSDGLDALSPEDRSTLEEIGVLLVCDLRTEDERTTRPNLTIRGAQNVVLDVLAGAGNPAEQMARQITEVIQSGDAAAQQALLGAGRGAQLMTDGDWLISLPSAQTAFAQMFTLFADPASLPAVFHCTAGKDRTGWATASFLTALGVPRPAVVDDYLLSNHYLAAKNEITLSQVASLIDPELMVPILGVAPEYLEASFAAVDAAYGSVDGWMIDGLGLDQATIDALRHGFLVG